MRAFFILQRPFILAFMGVCFCNFALAMASGKKELPQSSLPSSTLERSLWGDTKTSVHWLLQASFEQFKTPSNAYYLGVGIPVTWYSFNVDDKVIAKARKKKVSRWEQFASDSSIVMNFPFFYIGMWYLGKARQKTKLMEFAMETAAASYLAILESGLLSHLQVHQRPNTNGLNFFETSFRGDSSWPSGHVIPYFALMFKTFQFYGPYWAIIPAGMAYLTASQRMKDARHWFSDITGAFFLTAFASEGVRKVAKSQDNHPVYKWIFEHDVRLGVVRYRDIWGPKLVWNF